MTKVKLFPQYTPRQVEEQEIETVIREVQQAGTSKAVLVYGGGGVGKSYLLRNLAKQIDIEKTICVGPIDIDDAEYWSITNLSRHIADELSHSSYFQEYRDALTSMPNVEKDKMGHETVLAHLRRTKRIFVEDYEKFILESELTPVLIIDTIEAIRGTDTVNRLLLWLKKLPGTVFVLAGRPVSFDPNFPDMIDPVEKELIEAPKVPYVKINIQEFTHNESLDYLNASAIVANLDESEKEKLAFMSKGHPLWLALSIYYLNTIGIPEEIENLELNTKDAPWPYQNGAAHDAFLRRLVIPYREDGFWHEAIFRLGIVRRRVSKNLWQELMADYSLPSDINSWDDAWMQLLKFPWIRPRANSKYVTLQDALAEELSKRIIPFRDFDKTHRVQMWQKAVDDYDLQIKSREKELENKQQELDFALSKHQSSRKQSDLLTKVLEFDKDNFDLFLLKTTRLYYQLLYDYQKGTEQFISLFREAIELHRVRLAELLWAEMQRFLPGEHIFDPLEDVVKPEIEGFRNWYIEDKKTQYNVQTLVARYLYQIGQPEQSVNLLDSLLMVCEGNSLQEYHIFTLRGNAYMRYPGRAKNAQSDFESALKCTRKESTEDLRILESKALGELGYFYRNVGNWKKAGDTYLDALRKIPITAFKESAAIQSQYAYVQALRGLYQDAHELVDSALEIRNTIGEISAVGMTLSVRGEVFRYERRFYQAMQTYWDAEEIFAQLDNWGWLGLIRQQMAICLFQAYQSEEFFPEYEDFDDMLSNSRIIVEDALDYCREYSRRSYPSALNRAGRILGVGFSEYDQALAYLEEGYKEAKDLADGWFMFANLIEFAELSYIASTELDNKAYLQKIYDKEKDIENAYEEYQFSDLRGRWGILQGQLAFGEAANSDDSEVVSKQLEKSLEYFATGLPLIAHGYVGSHGAIALKGEFNKLEKVLVQLGEKKRIEWFRKLDETWSKRTEGIRKDRQESSLLASLKRSYVKLQVAQKMRDSNHDG